MVKLATRRSCFRSLSTASRTAAKSAFLASLIELAFEAEIQPGRSP